VQVSYTPCTARRSDYINLILDFYGPNVREHMHVVITGIVPWNAFQCFV